MAENADPYVNAGLEETIVRVVRADARDCVLGFRPTDRHPDQLFHARADAFHGGGFDRLVVGGKVYVIDRKNYYVNSAIREEELAEFLAKIGVYGG